MRSEVSRLDDEIQSMQTKLSELKSQEIAAHKNAVVAAEEEEEAKEEAKDVKEEGKEIEQQSLQNIVNERKSCHDQLGKLMSQKVEAEKAFQAALAADKDEIDAGDIDSEL